MSPHNIGTLGLPERRYRPDKSTRRADNSINFETRADAVHEDAKRAAMLDLLSRNASHSRTRKAAAALARKLNRPRSGSDVPKTMASSQFMRSTRINVAGALWALVEDPSFGTPGTFTTIGRGLEIPGDELSDVDPRRICAAFRTDLNRCGAARSDGYLAAFIDGEYEPATDVFRLHFHGLVAGGMRDVVNRLRRRPKYRTSRKVQTNIQTRCLQRVKISRAPLTDMPDPITYLLKSFWSSRWEGPVDGTMRRQNRKSRIKEPRHSELLLWFDRWSLEDIALLMGLRVTSSGLLVTRPKLYTNGDKK